MSLLTKEDLLKIHQQTCTAVIAGANFIAKEALTFDRKKVEVKGLNDLVSFVDRQTEELLKDSLGKIIPGCRFLAEESGKTDSQNSSYRWIIDPLDGTTNFVHAVPVYCISVALEYKESTLLGVVMEVNSGELFHAVRGEGAWLNDKKISVSGAHALSESLLGTGFPVNKFARVGDYLRLLEDLVRSSHGLRRLGSAAYDLCNVACGRFDAYYEIGLSPWDVAAGALIVSEAGGKVSDFGGGENYIFGEEIIASNGHIHQELQSRIQHFLRAQP
jgi:myo-inositol-1(or 4)-monophosphatase